METQANMGFLSHNKPVKSFFFFQKSNWRACTGYNDFTSICRIPYSETKFQTCKSVSDSKHDCNNIAERSESHFQATPMQIMSFHGNLMKIKMGAKFWSIVDHRYCTFSLKWTWSVRCWKHCANGNIVFYLLDICLGSIVIWKESGKNGMLLWTRWTVRTLIITGNLITLLQWTYNTLMTTWRTWSAGWKYCGSCISKIVSYFQAQYKPASTATFRECSKETLRMSKQRIVQSVEILKWSRKSQQYSGKHICFQIVFLCSGVKNGLIVCWKVPNWPVFPFLGMFVPCKA